jgi:cellulose/xylan binding protein with CBM9 domain
MPRPELRLVAPKPRSYLARRRNTFIEVDGKLEDAAWALASWTEPFTDIEGDIRPAPRLATRVKMLWDDRNWYIAAQLEEPDLWATIRERDAVIFRDNDFELFVDPDGDTHRYFELELNAFATVWDLFLPKPYRDGGHADNGWNIEGLQVAVAVDGTLNDARDRDRSWTVELAIPWAAFADSGRTRVPPREGDIWPVNFSRVEWDLDRAADGYRKRVDGTGKPFPEHNWVWSPQGAINMHMPEMWGLVQFGGGAFRSASPADDEARWTLRRVYYAQRDYRRAHGSYAPSVATLGLLMISPALELKVVAGDWEASLPGSDRRVRWHIDADGRIFRQ